MLFSTIKLSGFGPEQSTAHGTLPPGAARSPHYLPFFSADIKQS
jgi:hypothetical protein